MADARETLGGHAFISYMRENSSEVDELQRTLEQAGVRVWRDTADLWPGEDWRLQIRRAITGDALVFIVCFSRASLARSKSYQNEELTLAIEQMRLRRPDDPWLIPVRFDNCEIPDWDIGGGRTLDSIQRADLFGDRTHDGTARLVSAVLRILGGHPGALASAVDHPVDKGSGINDELSHEAITLNFDEAGGPAAEGILPILDDYARELFRGSLDGYKFSPRQLSVINPPDHDVLVTAFREHGYRGVQREVREMDEWYIRGTIMLLNRLFIGENQTNYTWRSIYWFNRAVRHRQVALMRGALPKGLQGSYGADFSSGLLSIIFDDRERFYGRALIKIDLWNADDHRDNMSFLFPRDGYAGSWFSEHPQSPEKYIPSHYDPEGYYDYLIPQMTLSHIARSAQMISDFTNYYIGAGLARMAGSLN